MHCLGELEHIFDKHNLKLRTNGCITLSYSQSSLHASASNIQDLDAFISSGTWTAGANRLPFHVELLFDDVAVSGSSVSQATEDIGIVFSNAQLWSQLCLDASLIVVESNKFSISLSAQLQSNADIRPPRGVPSACLKSISMTFHISTCRRTRYASRAQVAVSPFRSEHTSASTDPIEKHFDRRCYCPLSSLGGSQGVLDTLTDGYAPWIFGASSVDTSPMSSQGSISSDADSTTSFDTLTDTPTTSHEYAIHEIKFELLVRLLDFSLRRMISDYKPGRSGGVVLSTDSGSPKLAAISPALFSPGYAKAVSQRTGLLPTIARTVSRMYRRTNSSRLKHKLRRLQGLSFSSSLDYGSIEDTDPSSATLSSSVEARLWFLTRSRLIDPLACKALKSLSTTIETGPGSNGMVDESLHDADDVMLDEGDVSIFDEHSQAMELDKVDHLERFQEQSLDRSVDEGQEDHDLFWEHCQDEVAYDGMESQEDDTNPSLHIDSWLSSAGY